MRVMQARGFFELEMGKTRKRAIEGKEERACARLEWLVRAHIHSERKHFIVHCTLR
jgi:hypothetical protein